MLELLSPAGSMDALRAAVQNGADAVYLGLNAFNARRGAKNFTLEELQEAVTYCHVRGVQVHLAINILVSDREMLEASECIRRAAQAQQAGALVTVHMDPLIAGVEDTEEV